MTAALALDIAQPSGPARGVALVLHGGRSNGHGRVTPLQLAVLRMLPFASALEHAGRRDGLAVARLRYAVRGWNGAEQSPVGDVRAALDRLAEQFPDVPVALVGHSMGGRAALYAADHPSVSAVVGLAPWIEAGDPVERLAGRRVLFVHGTQDRMTSARASEAMARQAASLARSVSFVSITGEHHAMLRRAGLWHQLAAGFVTAVLLGQEPSDSSEAGRVLAQALAGDPSLVV